VKIVVLDVETGGLDPQKDSILSLGAVVWEDGELKERIYFMVNEGDIKADPKALAINGLSVEEVQREGADPKAAVAMFRQWMANAGLNVMPGKVTMGGHNVAFDAGFVERLFRLAGARNPFAYRRICTQSAALFLMAAGKLPGISGTGLDSLCAHFHIDIREGGAQGRHNAQEDAVATAKLLTMLVEVVK